jgi:hypothetical protein
MEGHTYQATGNTPVGVRRLYRDSALPQVRAKRVAAYCRVSTELEQQQSSLATIGTRYGFHIFQNNRCLRVFKV